MKPINDLNAGPQDDVLSDFDINLNKFSSPCLKVENVRVAGDHCGHVVLIEQDGPYFTTKGLREYAEWLNAIATWFEKGGK